MDRVVLKEVAKVVKIHEWVVDGSNLSLSSSLRHSSSEGESSNSSESVDSKSDSGHVAVMVCLLQEVLFIYKAH